MDRDISSAGIFPGGRRAAGCSAGPSNKQWRVFPSGRKGICTHQLIRPELPKGKSVTQHRRCWKGANPSSKKTESPIRQQLLNTTENCLSTSLEVKFKLGAYVTAFWQEDKLRAVRGPQMDALKEGRCLPDRVPLHGACFGDFRNGCFSNV